MYNQFINWVITNDAEIKYKLSQFSTVQLNYRLMLVLSKRGRSLGIQLVRHLNETVLSLSVSQIPNIWLDKNFLNTLAITWFTINCWKENVNGSDKDVDLIFSQFCNELYEKLNKKNDSKVLDRVYNHTKHVFEFHYRNGKIKQIRNIKDLYDIEYDESYFPNFIQRILNPAKVRQQSISKLLDNEDRE